MKRVCVDHVSGDLAPLPALRALPKSMSEDDILRLFLADVGEKSPVLRYLSEYGMTLAHAREFFSVFAGRRIDVPSKHSLARAWDDIRIRMALQIMSEAGVSAKDAVDKVSKRFGASQARVEKLQAKNHKDFA